MVCILCWDKKSFFRIMRTYQDTSQETRHTCCTALIFTSMNKLIFNISSDDIQCINLNIQGQFWLKSDMDTFGQWGPISVLPNYESTGIFTMNRIKSLDKPNKSCESEDEYSYTECLRRYVTRTSNCSIDILANKYNCTSEGFVKLLDTLNELRTMTKYDTSKTTGCLQKCTVQK